MNIKKFLAQHPEIDYLQRVLRHASDPQFREHVLSYHRDPNLLHFVKAGEKYQSINFYDIYMDYPSKGFFALLCQTLDALRYAEKFNLTPVVTWSDSCLYKDNGIINDSENPFEYYFEPVSCYCRSDISAANRVLRYHACQRSEDREHPFNIVSQTIIKYNYYDQYISENARIWKKMIHIKAPVTDYMDNSMHDIGFQGKTIGVHVRATDFRKGYVNHAVAVSESEYIAAVKRALNELQGVDKIFLATDDQETLKLFQSEFSGMVIYYADTFRSTDGEAVHFSESTRPNHKYRLGLEVMRDMYTLSRCNGLIGGYSNVCIAAQIVNMASGNVYEYVNMINKGFHETGKTVLQDRYGK